VYEMPEADLRTPRAGAVPLQIAMRPEAGRPAGKNVVIACSLKSLATWLAFLQGWHPSALAQ